MCPRLSELEWRQPGQSENRAGGEEWACRVETGLPLSERGRGLEREQASGGLAKQEMSVTMRRQENLKVQRGPRAALSHMLCVLWGGGVTESWWLVPASAECAKA